MQGALALVVLVAVALAAAATAPTVFEIQLSPAPRDGVVVVEDRAGPVGVYAAQANGRVLVRVEGRGRHVARITSTSHAFAVLRFVVPADGGLLQAWADEPALVWSGDALMAVALGPARLFEERAVFSWMGLLQNPMVYMGLLSVVMMGMMQCVLLAHFLFSRSHRSTSDDVWLGFGGRTSRNEGRSGARCPTGRRGRTEGPRSSQEEGRQEVTAPSHHARSRLALC